MANQFSILGLNDPEPEPQRSTTTLQNTSSRQPNPHLGYLEGWPSPADSPGSAPASSPTLPVTAPTIIAEDDELSVRVIKRYRDAYRVARFINGCGEFIKVVGLVGGLIIAFGTFSLMHDSFRQSGFVGGSADKNTLIIVGIAPGVCFAFVFWVLGVLISAVGQIDKALLDSAVYASPFLTNVQKGKAMSL
jgi:hypothetical protein